MGGSTQTKRELLFIFLWNNFIAIEYIWVATLLQGKICRPYADSSSFNLLFYIILWCILDPTDAPLQDMFSPFEPAVKWPPPESIAGWTKQLGNVLINRSKNRLVLFFFPHTAHCRALSVPFVTSQSVYIRNNVQQHKLSGIDASQRSKGQTRELCSDNDGHNPCDNRPTAKTVSSFFPHDSGGTFQFFRLQVCRRYVVMKPCMHRNIIWPLTNLKRFKKNFLILHVHFSMML